MEVVELKYNKKLLEDLVNIETSCFLGEAWTKDMLASTFSNTGSYLALGIYDGEKVVADTVLIYSLEYGEIATVGVLPHYRGRGYATALLKALIFRAQKLGVKSITLEVNAHNFVAVGLYEKFGFKTAGIRHNYYENPIFDSADAMIMCLNLALQ